MLDGGTFSKSTSQEPEVRKLLPVPGQPGLQGYRVKPHNNQGRRKEKEINLSEFTALNRCKVSRWKEGIVSLPFDVGKASVEHNTSPICRY